MNTRVGVVTGLAAALMLAIPAAAQRPSPAMPGAEPRQREAALFVGISQLDINEFNAKIYEGAYLDIDRNLPQVGFSWAMTRQGVRFGFEMAGGGSRSGIRRDSRYRYDLTAGHALFNIGVLAVERGGLALHPKVGIGGGGLSFNITDRQPATFEQILIDPARNVSLTQASLLVDASMGATYRLRPDGMSRGGRSLMLGVRAGYTTSLLHGDWRSGRNDAPGGPDAGWGGPHVEFMIGRATAR
jgi:hypothetical protein